jgi:hypothetical protein
MGATLLPLRQGLKHEPDRVSVDLRASKDGSKANRSSFLETLTGTDWHGTAV